MIKLVRLSGEVIYLNYFQIESMELIPETKVRLTNGNYYLVKDTAESISQQIVELLHQCVAGVPGGVS